MFLTSLPLDYVRLLDRGDRIRRTRARTSDSRVRKTNAGDE
jgi:hypothetical protein